MNKLITLVLVSLIASVSPVQANENIELVVLRSEHKLLVQQDGITLRSFKVALGSAGKKAKLQAGDRATPLGEYRIRMMRDSDRFHQFLQIDYPNVSDALRALKNDLISREQYNAILDAHIYGKIPPQNTALGGDIGIHGIGVETKDKLEIHQISDWTQGCIAMRNDEIEQLKRYISVGTKIKIMQ
ncbi:MAG: L,D-transpeptidase [Gammaproteobacteria bacterium]|nr:L,D-transpeptidase [Gammaproteobacteria bacterium]